MKKQFSESQTKSDDACDRSNRRQRVDSIPQNLDGLDDKDENST